MKPSSSCEVSILLLADSYYRNLIFSGQAGASVLFEEERLAGFKGKDGNSGRGASLKCLRAEAGDVEAQIVALLGNFDGDGAAVFAGELAAARQAFVGALKGLDRQDGAAFDQDSLADFKAGDFLR